MADPTKTSLEFLSRSVRRHPNDRLIRSIAHVAENSPQVRSMLISATIKYAQPGWRSLDLVREFSAELTAHDFLSALTAGGRTVTRELLSVFSSADRSSPPGLDYAEAIIDRRFIEAFDIWKEFPEVEAFLNSLPMPAETPEGRSIAVVLPGPADSDHGRQIDSHDVVGRTVLIAPTTSGALSVGTRFDVAFLNWNRFQEIRNSASPMVIEADRIVTSVGFRHRSTPSWLSTEVDYELENVRTPTSLRSYMPLKIVTWCLQRGFRPTLYCADFYLGSTPYQSPDYDSLRILETEIGPVVSYLRHDVFFSHAALRHWRSQGAIFARGRLAEILDLDGRSFAEALQNRWGSK